MQGSRNFGPERVLVEVSETVKKKAKFKTNLTLIITLIFLGFSLTLLFDLITHGKLIQFSHQAAFIWACIFGFITLLSICKYLSRLDDQKNIGEAVRLLSLDETGITANRVLLGYNNYPSAEDAESFIPWDRVKLITITRSNMMSKWFGFFSFSYTFSQPSQYELEIGNIETAEKPKENMSDMEAMLEFQKQRNEFYSAGRRRHWSKQVINIAREYFTTDQEQQICDCMKRYSRAPLVVHDERFL